MSDWNKAIEAAAKVVGKQEVVIHTPYAGAVMAALQQAIIAIRALAKSEGETNAAEQAEQGLAIAPSHEGHAAGPASGSPQPERTQMSNLILPRIGEPWTEQSKIALPI